MLSSNTMPLPDGIKPPLMVAYGGGVNSTAMILGMMERGIVPGAILMADTGGEKPETYDYVRMFSAHLVGEGFPEIIMVQNDGAQPTLEGSCLENQQLPSIVFGRRACSEKYKQRPQHKWAKKYPPAVECWAAKQKVLKAIGYDADEKVRAHIRDDDFYDYVYFLIQWGWTRNDCAAAISRHDLDLPIKSACFFCPSSKKSEVLQLNRLHPELAARAVDMERNAAANMENVKGLGRNWSWEKLLHHDASLPMLWDDPLQFECVCLGEVNEGEGIDADDAVDQAR